jgi:hypothetical protein
LTNFNIYFASFADKRLHKSLTRIGVQAKGSGFFKKVFLSDESDLDNSFKRKYRRFLQPATFYLCAWKPQIILQCFEKMNDGDVLLYADSGCHINKNGLQRFNEYIKLCKENFPQILATVFNDDMPEFMWTKADTFDYFDCRNDNLITHTAQIQATTFCIEKNKETISFITDWLKVFEDRPDLAIRNEFIKANFVGYKDHRSDQSFFSILGKKAGIKLISADEVQGSSEWEKEMKKFPIWAMRDKEYDNSLINNLTFCRIKNAFKNRIKALLNLKYR